MSYICPFVNLKMEPSLLGRSRPPLQEPPLLEERSSTLELCKHQWQGAWLAREQKLKTSAAYSLHLPYSNGIQYLWYWNVVANTATPCTQRQNEIRKWNIFLVWDSTASASWSSCGNSSCWTTVPCHVGLLYSEQFIVLWYDQSIVQYKSRLPMDSAHLTDLADLPTWETQLFILIHQLIILNYF